MSNEQFIQLAKKLVRDYVNGRSDKTDNVLIADTTVPDGMYYEITYNGDKRECYFDAYKKWENRCHKVEA